MDLVTANHVLASENVVDAFGHVSVRHPQKPDRFFLSCSRSPALVSMSDIMEFNLDGTVCGPDDRKPYLERFIHGAIYEARDDIHSVVHNHSADLIPFGVTNTPVKPLLHVAGAIGKEVPIWDIRDSFGDTSLLVTNMTQARDLSGALGDATAILMRGHGAVVTGHSIKSAVLTAIYLQLNAKLDWKARHLGEVRYLSEGEIAASDETLLAQVPSERAWAYFVDRSKNARSALRLRRIRS
ncbi:class II aldolase/adducin family protein [Bradyrhizobium sp. NP1]|uniref:class II aldolase/adducin family protein n=1 Tax=Bradyrhizobium sp. NP1 TaxID=3049772 RepID=UPI0025A63757|nr:class II aldolase/adducin family protein [Bradyrhizobium sp. NP1]WJR75845.1 class II aldolase/adducin family protein [Bradyrhizobium sp. NP1]